VTAAYDFYDYADEHFDWAETAKTERERAIFLQMAAAWLEVAQQWEAGNSLESEAALGRSHWPDSSRSILSSPYRVVEKAVNVVLDEIVTAMARKDRVELRGFGAFSVKDRAGRIGRNPKSGVKVEVPEKSVPVFRPSKEIGRRLNPVVSIPESSERISRRSR
jgi:integration host factor subunit beta